VRVFVTGGTGFFGAHLVSALASAGHRVTVLARDPARVRAGADVVIGDLRDPRALDGVLRGHDVCVHGALVWGEAAEDVELFDARASARVFAACGDAGVGHVIYTSSTAVHRPWSGVMRASDVLGCVDAYGATKVAGEALLSALHHTHGVRAHVVRPGPIVDAPAFAGAPLRIDRKIGAMIETAKRDGVIEVPRSGGRQLVGAAELAGLYVRSLAYDAPLAHVVAVAPRVVSWVEIAELVVARAGRGRVELLDEDAPSPVFDVSATEAALGPIGDAGAALDRAITSALGT
jgi:UDP-glucose 4-epimerase